MITFTVATGVPAVLVLGAVTGWSHSAIGMPTWAAWTIAALATLIGLPLAWFSTPLGPRTSMNVLVKIYRSEGLEALEQERLSRFAPHKAGGQLFNLALALDRQGDQDGAEAVYRRAADRGSPPAMVNLANRLSRRGHHDEAMELYRRAADCGFPLAMVNLAMLLSQRGNHDEARELYRRAAEAGFTPGEGR